MLYSAAAVKYRLKTVCMTVILGIVGSITAPITVAAAAGTQVNATVCGGTGGGATITIISPASDSVTNQSPVNVSGDVSNATQIAVTVDDDYNSTVPLDAQQTTYSFDVNLAEGTHTIKLVANDVCQTQDASASVVVTYQPQTQPGEGTTTPTQTGGVTIGKPAQKGSEMTPLTQPLDKMAIIGPIFSFMGWSAHMLDLDSTSQASGGASITAARFVLVMAGLVLIVFANVALGAVLRLPGLNTLRPLQSMSHWHGWHQWLIRVVGLGLFLVAFTL